MMWRRRGPEDGFAGSSVAARAPCCLGEASGARRWRETASGFGLNQWRSVEECGLSGSSSGYRPEDLIKQCGNVSSFWLATEAVGSLGMQRSLFFALPNRTSPKSAQYLLWRSPRSALDQDARFGQIRMVENRATTGGRLVPIYTTQKPHRAQQHQSAASAPRRRAPSKRPNRRS